MIQGWWIPSLSTTWKKKHANHPISNTTLKRKWLIKDHWHLQCDEQQKNKLNLKKESKEKKNNNKRQWQ